MNIIFLLTELLKWMIFLIVLLALTVATFSEENLYPPNILTGEPSLLVIGSNIMIELKSINVKTISLKYSKPINERYIKVLNEDENVALKLKKEWLHISHMSGKNLPDKIFLRISTPKGPISVNRIESAKINGAEVNLHDFVTSHANLNPNQVSFRYKYSISNIGNLFANYIGVYLPVLIIWFLAPLSLAQLFKFLSVAFLSVIPKKITKKHKGDILDWITENLAIPFGLLGTISALWTSFEFLNVDFGNAYAIIQTLSAGLFTTFLGLFSYGIMKGRNMLVKYSNEQS